MASPSAMAACLRADARLLCADSDPEAYENLLGIADNVNAEVASAVADLGLDADDVKIILMLAAAAALEE